LVETIGGFSRYDRCSRYAPKNPTGAFCVTGDNLLASIEIPATTQLAWNTIEMVSFSRLKYFFPESAVTGNLAQRLKSPQ
jgi:hypothetical protein